ncbi:hypothetical protein [Streptomyces sp. NPDC000410]|uniref:hypothetical protein n=1 Tax=Streptomyces sp. NPDC000410 TaxID=3154254 RepID=UPI0033164D53
MNTFAAILQLLVAAAFLSIPVVRARYGAKAKAAAEAELTRQGVPVTVLAENNLRFDAGGHETVVPVSVSAVMVAVAGLNLAGNDWGHLLTWIFSSIVFLGNVAILYSNLTAVKGVEAAFKRKGDPMLLRINVAAFLKAAENAFPSWTWILQNVRHTVVFAGSALALVATIVA